MNLRPILTLSAHAALLSAPFTTASAQGSLTPPPGPPVAGMKTLDQVEARTPLVPGAAGVSISAAGTITISQPGSYYLTKNVNITTNVNGLEINADATVDLNGFGITGTAAAITTGDAIVIAPAASAVVRNGFIRGGTTMPAANTYERSGFRHGVIADELPEGVKSSVTIRDLRVSGVRYDGIRLRRLSAVERCTVQTTGGNGISCTPFYRPDTTIFESRHFGVVRDCYATDCGGQYGIAAQQVTGSFGHTTFRPSSQYMDAPCGIVAKMVENSTGWAITPKDISGEHAFGIHAPIIIGSMGRSSIPGKGLSGTTVVSSAGGS